MTTRAVTHDLVIRGGLLLDGTGAPARRGDVAVRDGRLSEVGAVSGRGTREIDAAGLAVAPGFIDPHTHYDAQITWDPLASCSSWHGVLVQRASGIAWSFVNGHPVVAEGRVPEAPPGRGPGRVLRAA